MADLQDLLIRIDATTEQLRRELKRAETSVDKSAGKIDKSLAKVDSKFVSLARTAAKAGAAAAAAFAIMGGTKLLQVARETDVFDAQLKTATGTAEGAAQAFAMLEKIAAETPFTLDQVVRGFVKLKNMGLDPSRESLMSYGNTASAMGKSLDQMIEAVADAATAEFERLKEFGIRAKNQGDTIAFTFRGITETVGNNAAEIEGYLKRIGDVEFAGAMTERANSLDGALSNLSDSWDALFRTVARGPVGAAIETQVRMGTMALQRLADMVARLQGTATPEQNMRGTLDELFMRRKALEERIASHEARPARGATPMHVLRGELKAVKDEIQATLAKMNELKRAASDVKLGGPTGLAGGTTGSGPKKGKVVSITAAADREMQSVFQAETDRVTQSLADADAEVMKMFQQLTEFEADNISRHASEVEKAMEQMTAFSTAAAENIQTAFADFLFDPFADGLDGMLSGFLETIRRMAAEIAAQQVLAGLFGGLAGSKNPLLAGIGSAFAGGRASGGAVSAGKMYRVGEFGPEMFTPTVSGRISPSSGVKVNVHNYGGAENPVKVQTSNVNGEMVVDVMVQRAVGKMFANGTIDRQFAAAGMNMRRTGRR